MSYLDIGYDEFLNRIEDSSSGQVMQKQLDPLQFDTFVDQISGSKIQGGAMISPDGRLKLDLENGAFKVNNGVEDLVLFGILPDGSVGLLIKNDDGKVLMQISSSKNVIQSPNEHFQADFDNERILAKDNKGLPRALFGKGDF